MTFAIPKTRYNGEVDRNLQLFQQLALSPGVSLAHAALCLARLEYPRLDLSHCLEWLKRKGAALSATYRSEESVVDRIQRLNLFLYQQEGFRPNIENYYDPRNSYLNDVIERKLGIPISLAILYMDLACCLHLKLNGVGFPGHFLIRNTETAVFYIDPFHSGQILLREDCESRFREATGGHLPFSDEHLRSASKVQILIRMLGNLWNIFAKQNRLDRAIEVLNWAIAIQPEAPVHFRDRGLLLARMECPEVALKDLQYYLESLPLTTERAQIERLIQTLRGGRTTIH